MNQNAVATANSSLNINGNLPPNTTINQNANAAAQSNAVFNIGGPPQKLAPAAATANKPPLPVVASPPPVPVLLPLDPREFGSLFVATMCC